MQFDCPHHFFLEDDAFSMEDGPGSTDSTIQATMFHIPNKHSAATILTGIDYKTSAAECILSWIVAGYGMIID